MKTRREGFELETDAETSARMAGIRRSGTRPEQIVRQLLSGLGLRYRLANEDLPGSPDLANRSARWAVFVHGCYWHRHDCKAATTPKRNRDFWEAKFARNVARDARAEAELDAKGYDVLTVWECETKGDASQAREKVAAWARAREED